MSGAEGGSRGPPQDVDNTSPWPGGSSISREYLQHYVGYGRNLDDAPFCPAPPKAEERSGRDPAVCAKTCNNNSVAEVGAGTTSDRPLSTPIFRGMSC